MLTESQTVTRENYALLPSGKFHTSRRGKVKAAVVHVTAGLQDLDLKGDDLSAENTNRWQLNARPEASWHRIADTDSVITCLPSWYTAWQAKGYNSTTVGNEVANADARWDNKTTEWVKRTIWNYALSYADYVVKYKIPLRRATKAELDAAIANDSAPVGFIDHSRLSTIRKDPGATFPWALFFDNIRAIIAGQEEVVIDAKDANTLWTTPQSKKGTMLGPGEGGQAAANEAPLTVLNRMARNIESLVQLTVRQGGELTKAIESALPAGADISRDDLAAALVQALKELAKDAEPDTEETPA